MTICKLEKIFPPIFFDPMEHLPIHLPYEAIAGGPVHFRWMYPFEREIHNLKKTVKNRYRVEGSICEAYIIKEISTFSSHYFQPNMQTRLNKVTRNDDGGEVDAPDGCLSIFLHPGRPSGEMNGCYLSDKEWDAARIYVLLNCEEIQQFIHIFEAELKRNSENISLEEIDKETNSRFANWFEAYKKYSFSGEDKVLVRKVFNRVGSERLSDSLGKAKKAFSRTKKIPNWIAQVHWDGLMRYWNSDDFKKISAINSKNRMSSNNGEGPSLHTGGSVAFAEYRRRHKELTGEELRNDELFLKTHKTKNEKKWICGKSERMWNTFTNTIKEKVGETSTLRNDEGLELDGGDMERNTTTNGEEEGEKTSEDDVNLLKNVPEEQLLKTWIETVGGTKRGKIYGLGSRNCLLADSLNVNCASSGAQNPSNTPTQQLFETPEFQQFLDRVLEQRMTNMQEHMHTSIRENMEAEVNIAVRAAVARILGFTPQPSPDGTGSTPNNMP